MKKKQIVAAALAAVLTAALPFSGYAGPSGTGTEDEELAARLGDNKLEYDEIAGLIENYNLTYVNTRTQILDGALNLGAAKGLSEEANELMDEARDLKTSDMDEASRMLYDSYKETAKELRKQAQKLTNQELSSSRQKTLRQAKNKLTKTVQNLLINYCETVSTQELMSKRVELAGEQADSVQKMYELGMKSSADVLAAQETLKQAENGMAQYQGGLQNLKQNILLLTGWSHDAEPEISPIPAADLTRIDSMDPQADLADAIGANYDLQNVKNASASGSADRGVKKRNIMQSEQDVSSALQSFYAAVQAKKLQYDAALADFQAAEQTMQAAELKNSMGMMGRLEYLNAEAVYLTAKSEKEKADMALFAAMEDYDWAVKGLIVKNGGGQ